MSTNPGKTKGENVSVPELQPIVDRIGETGNPHVETVRDLLGRFGRKRRGWWVVETVKKALVAAGLSTEPDIEAPPIDGSLQFTLLSPHDKKSPTTHTKPTTDRKDDYSSEDAEEKNPTQTVRTLLAAKKRDHVVSVTREQTVADAVTLMLRYDYSQLPVMVGERHVHGMISWRSIGAARIDGRSCHRVADCYEREYDEVKEDTPLLEAVEKITKHEAVLVRGTTATIVGIVTTNDLSLRFHVLIEPILLLEEIETRVRRLLDGVFSREELAAMRDVPNESREITDASDLSIGGYKHRIEKEEDWARLKLALSRKQVINLLDDVRKIRNEVMHQFSMDELSHEDLDSLRGMRRLLLPLKSHPSD